MSSKCVCRPLQHVGGILSCSSVYVRKEAQLFSAQLIYSAPKNRTHCRNINMAESKKAAHELQSRTRTDDVLNNGGVEFSSLLLSKPVLEGLSASGFQRPSPIQLKAIPLGRCGLGTKQYQNKPKPTFFCH